jgi:outer membrane biosynthesis protein TonB
MLFATLAIDHYNLGPVEGVRHFMKLKSSGKKSGSVWKWVVAGLIGLAAVMALGGYVVATQFPEVGANAAMVLRRIIGDQAVAQLETIVYAFEDSAHHLEAQVGVAQAPTPWEAAPTFRPEPALPTATPRPPTATPTPVSGPTATGPTPVPATTEPPTPQPTATVVWNPTPLAPFTSMKDEGQWQPYIQDGTGQTVAYRTRLFPDLTRLYYAEAIIVAFNLDAVRLHFELGTDEPKSSVAVARLGKIPAEDLKIGHLLAAFNGGFLAQHGAFGAMSGGVVVLPPRDNFATVAIYDDGRVRLGAWGQEIGPDLHLVAWRQNGPLLIDNGQINPETRVDLPRDWGYSVGGETVIWRSALGISPDGHTLYYVAGPNLTLPMLASAMAVTGAQFAMQLDINDYWVFFCTFYPNETDASHIETWALDQVMRYKNRDRYLNGFERDFFYLTSTAY